MNQIHILQLFAFVQENCTTAILLYTYIIEEILLWISYAKRGILTIFLLHLAKAMHLRILLASSNYH